MQQPRHLRPILIAGPTASGKSALALAAARHCGGAVINADSMQVYRDLRVLTARPSPDEEAQVPHRLYGHVDAADAYSVARWLADVSVVLDDCRRAGSRPIVVGGTGLYFKALTEGLSPIPAIPDDVRRHWRSEAARIGAPQLHALLARSDRVMAARLAPGDTQRLTRALEVLSATGKSIAEWQRQKGPGLVDPETAVRIAILPPREALHQRCDRRFDLMLAGGALDEVAALRARQLPPELPVMAALGVRPLLAHLDGNMPLAAAVSQGKLETRQYVKRQQTWFNRNISSFIVVQKILNCENAPDLLHLIDA